MTPALLVAAVAATSTASSVGRSSFGSIADVRGGGSYARATAPISDGLELAPAGRRLLIPVAGILPGALRDVFTAPRSGGRVHEAIDIMAPRGTPVVSATDGKLLKLHSSRLGGLMVYAADAADRFILMYAHLDRYAPGLTPGATIRRGQLLGYVGTTGNAPKNAPHLHFAIARGKPSERWWKGTPVNPYPLLARAATLDAARVEEPRPTPVRLASATTSAPSKVAKRPVAKRATAKTTTARTAVAKKVSAKKGSAKKVSAKKTTVKKTVAKKTVAKKTVAKKTVAKKTVAKKTVAKKTVAKKTVAKKTVAKKTVAKAASARKSSSAKRTSSPKRATAKKATTSRKSTASGSGALRKT